jgi:hypothetical protein
LANKYIIIAPENEKGLRSKLRSIIPVAFVTAAGAAVLHFFQKKAMPVALSESYRAAEGIAAAGAGEPNLLRAADDAAKMAPHAAFSLPQDIAIWFIVGALCALTLYFAADFIRRKKGW